jgi:hypothetical protein
LHTGKRFRRETLETRNGSDLSRSVDQHDQMQQGSRCQDTRLRLQADNTQGWQFRATMLSAGIIFCLGIVTNATTMRGVQSNIDELARVSLALERLAARSRDLAMPPGNPAARAEEMAPTEPAKTVVIGLDTPLDETPQEFPQSTPAAPMREPGERPAYAKWGPPLLLTSSRPARTAIKPDAYPRIKDLQSDLIVLGFDLGEDREKGIAGTRTLQALNEFRLLYSPLVSRHKPADSNKLATTVTKYAELARKDQRRFGVDSGILAAIRLGSLRTGVDFPFLMELAAAESSFDPTRVARTTAATGLFQFKDDTWLEAVKTYGKKYGIGRYASQVEDDVDDTGRIRPTIQDPAVRQHVLDLRHNPRISALLAAEYVKYNMKQLSRSLAHEPGYTELYLSHFFGTSGAISFLKVLDENPDRLADEVLPRAAENNQSIFHTKLSKPRTVSEVYKIFDRKFNTSRYKDANPS